MIWRFLPLDNLNLVPSYIYPYNLLTSSSLIKIFAKKHYCRPLLAIILHHLNSSTPLCHNDWSYICLNSTPCQNLCLNQHLVKTSETTFCHSKMVLDVQGGFSTGPPKKLEYVRPRFGESTLTWIVLYT